MEVDGDRFGVNNDPPLVVDIGESDIGLDRHVWLTLQVVFPFDHMRRLFNDRFYILALIEVGFEVNIGRARVDLDGVLGHGCRGVHVRRQHFQIDLDLFRRGFGVFAGVGADDGDDVAILVDLVVVQDRTVPAVSLVGREGDQAGDAVSPLDVLVGNDLENAGHLLGLGAVDPLDDGVGDFGLDECALEGVFGELGPHVFAEIPQPADLGNECGARNTGTVNPAVGRCLYSMAASVISPRSTLAASMTASTIML